MADHDDELTPLPPAPAATTTTTADALADVPLTRPEGPAKVGNAPLMKRTKFTVTGHDPLSVVYKFLKKQLRLKDTDALFVYCNSSFAPSPDQKLSSLYACFHVSDVLVLNYSLTQAWG